MNAPHRNYRSRYSMGRHKHTPTNTIARNVSHCRSTSSGWLIALIATLTFCGCTSPMFSRYPTFQASNPRSEARSFMEHDPFPDPDIGPDSGGRPREFSVPRTESRRAAEQRLLYGLPSMPEASPAGTPRGGLRRPLAVY